MKRLLYLIVAGMIVVLIFCFVRPVDHRSESRVQAVKASHTLNVQPPQGGIPKVNKMGSKPKSSDAAPARPLLAAFKASLLGTNQMEMKMAFRALAKYLAQNPDQLSDVLASLKTESTYPQLFSWMSQWDAEDMTVEGQKIIKAWAGELARTDRSAEGQQAAFGLLIHSMPDAEFVPMIAQLFREAANNQLQVSAVVTLKDWADRNPQLQGAIQDQLVEMINASSDEEVRERAFEAVASVGLSDATLTNATDLLWQESTDANRGLFAMAFDKAGRSARDVALGRLEQVCNDATDLATKRVTLAQIVRIGKGASSQILQRLNASHPELQQDVKDYVQILHDGAADIATIDRKKLEAELQSTALPEQTPP